MSFELGEMGDDRRGAVVPQAAGVDALGHEGVPEREHLDERRELGRVAVIVGVDALGQGRAGGGFDRDDPQSGFGELVGQERQAESAEVAAAADAGDEHVGLFADELELPLRLQPDDGLVHQDVVEHAAEGVLGVVVRGGVLHRLGDGDAEAAGRFRDPRRGRPGRPWCGRRAKRRPRRPRCA